MVMGLTRFPARGPGFVATLASFPTWFAQVGFEDPVASTLLLTGLAMDPLFAWSGVCGSVPTHPLLVVVLVSGSWPVSSVPVLLRRRLELPLKLRIVVSECPWRAVAPTMVREHRLPKRGT